MDQNKLNLEEEVERIASDHKERMQDLVDAHKNALAKLGKQHKFEKEALETEIQKQNEYVREHQKQNKDLRIDFNKKLESLHKDA